MEPNKCQKDIITLYYSCYKRPHKRGCPCIHAMQWLQERLQGVGDELANLYHWLGIRERHGSE
jgi:hypothetical protein